MLSYRIKNGTPRKALKKALSDLSLNFVTLYTQKRSLMIHCFCLKTITATFTTSFTASDSLGGPVKHSIYAQVKKAH